MAIVQISKIQIRTGAESDLPQLDIGELGFAVDTKNTYIGNDPLLDPPEGIEPTLTQILTDSPNCHINASQITGVLNIKSSDIKITGGFNGYVLQTDGTGNLSWAAGVGGAGSGVGFSTNTQLVFNDNGISNGSSNLTYISSTSTLNLTGNLVATNITGVIAVNANSQPNITSLGNLIVANVTGNLKSGNANLGNLATSNYFSGNGSLLTSVAATTAVTVTSSSQSNITSVGNLTGLTVNGVTTLGSVGNIKITGGAGGQLLTTDGTGNLSWATPTANGNVYGNANVASYLNSGFFNTTFIGSIPEAVHANYADVANSIAGARVTGQVSNSLIAGTVYTNAQPNITSTGNLIGLQVGNAITTGRVIVDINGNVNATGNISASYLKGNGSSITGSIENAINLVSGGTINGTVTATTQLPTDNSTKVATTEFVKSALSVLYPVGSVYTNATDNTNPFTLFGFGTWVAFGSGKVLVGVDIIDPLFSTVGNTGGSKDAVVVSHTHSAGVTITDPGHLHAMDADGRKVAKRLGSDGVIDGDSRVARAEDANYSGSQDTGTTDTGITVAVTNSTTGVAATDKNLQPYVVVYMWKRTV